MKTILSTRYIDVPEGVTVDVHAREVVVKGPRGSLSRNFKHLNLDIQKVDEGSRIRVDLWFGTRKQVGAGSCEGGGARGEERKGAGGWDCAC
jgi:large subunit ribosomal protein L9e